MVCLSVEKPKREEMTEYEFCSSQLPTDCTLVYAYGLDEISSKILVYAVVSQWHGY